MFLSLQLGKNDVHAEYFLPQEFPSEATVLQHYSPYLYYREIKVLACQPQQQYRDPICYSPNALYEMVTPDSATTLPRGACLEILLYQ